MIFQRALLLALAVPFAATLSFAADAGNPALKNATKPDDDFFLQGEYAGSLEFAMATAGRPVCR